MLMTGGGAASSAACGTASCCRSCSLTTSTSGCDIISRDKISLVSREGLLVASWAELWRLVREVGLCMSAMFPLGSRFGEAVVIALREELPWLEDVRGGATGGCWRPRRRSGGD